VPTVVGVKLRFANKVLYFDPQQTEPSEGELVIVETDRGKEMGEVVSEAHDVPKAEIVSPLKPVLRVASQSDADQLDGLRAQEDEAMPVFRELIEKHELDMKPVAVEYLFDGTKIVFYFSAEERVDFRDLVRDLASRFKARIDMRQVGVRDEARMVGGIGHCGQMLCCVRFPGDFQPVSIRMAKEQDLPLNPLKISGLCGRLMCCLRYEYDAYKDFKSRAPKRNSKVETPVGEGKVVELNTPLETVKLRFADGGNMRVPLSAMDCSCESGCPCKVTSESLEAAGVQVPASVSLAAKASQAKADSQTEQKPSGGRKKRGGRKRGGRGRQGDKQGGAQGSKQGSKQGSGGSGKSGGSRKGGGKSGGGRSSGQNTDGQKSGDQKPKSSSGRRRRRRRRPSGGGEKPGGQKNSDTGNKPT
jgi:cell fate regulator YaaT (PSP1 superfamily)